MQLPTVTTERDDILITIKSAALCQGIFTPATQQLINMVSCDSSKIDTESLRLLKLHMFKELTADVA